MKFTSLLQCEEYVRGSNKVNNTQNCLNIKQIAQYWFLAKTKTRICLTTLINAPSCINITTLVHGTFPRNQSYSHQLNWFTFRKIINRWILLVCTSCIVLPALVGLGHRWKTAYHMYMYVHRHVWLHAHVHCVYCTKLTVYIFQLIFNTFNK